MMLCVGCLAATLGCRGLGLPTLSLFGIKQDTLVLGVVAQTKPLLGNNPLELLNPDPGAPYEPLARALGRAVQRPAAVMPSYAFQIGPYLSRGVCQLAIVPAAEYVRLGSSGDFRALALPMDAEHRVKREAVLITRVQSPLEQVADLRGQVVAFGPAGDARTHWAALKLLADNGIAKTDLQLELLPLPGSLKHMPHMRAVAQTVANGSSAAGFLDIATWEALPEATTDSDEPARDKLKIIAETEAVPDEVVILSPRVDAALADRLRAALLTLNERDPEALWPLKIHAFCAPPEHLLDDLRRLSPTSGG